MYIKLYWKLHLKGPEARLFNPNMILRRFACSPLSGPSNPALELDVSKLKSKVQDLATSLFGLSNEVSTPCKICTDLAVFHFSILYCSPNSLTSDQNEL